MSDYDAVAHGLVPQMACCAFSGTAGSSASLRGEPPSGLRPAGRGSAAPCLDPSLLAGPALLSSLTCGDVRISMPGALPVRLRAETWIRSELAAATASLVVDETRAAEMLNVLVRAQQSRLCFACGQWLFGASWANLRLWTTTATDGKGGTRHLCCPQCRRSCPPALVPVAPPLPVLRRAAAPCPAGNLAPRPASRSLRRSSSERGEPPAGTDAAMRRCPYGYMISLLY